MSIIHRIRPSVNTKPSRVSPVRPVPFGQGILPTCPHYGVASHTAADEAWLVADNAARETARFVDLRRSPDPYTRERARRMGLITPELAEFLGMDLGGHRS